jgi:RHS repeat-associated protein
VGTEPPLAPDGDKSPSESADKSAHSKVVAATPRWKKRLILFAFGALVAPNPSNLFAGEIRSFPTSYGTVLAEEITAEAPVLFRAMRFNEATEQWNVDLVVTNQGERSFTQSLFLAVEGFSNTTGPLAFDGVSTNLPVRSFIRNDFGGVLAPGSDSPSRTIALGFVEGAGAPRLQLRVFGIPFGSTHALALTRSLNEVGQPLTGVRVIERGPPGDRELFTDPDYGVVTLGALPGEHTWKFERDEYLPVWRQQTLLRGAVRLVPNPRLVRRNTNSTLIAAGTTNLVQDSAGHVRLEFAVPQSGDGTPVTLTMVDGQTLPGQLPQGWSPLRAFWIESTNAPLTALLSMTPGVPIAPTESVALLKWNEDTVEWRVQARLTGDGTNAMAHTLQGWGAYAMVVGDSGSLAPPAPVAGQPLPPSPTPLQAAPVFAASGTVTPSSSPASRVADHVTATASVLVTNSTGVLPSGLTLRTEVTEDYRLQDSSTRFMALYETFITAYRRPVDTAPRALNATFPMRPLLIFGGDELAEATVRVDVLPPDIFRGGVFDLFGGSMTNNRVRISATPGDFASPQAAILRTLVSTNLPALLIPGQSIAAVFDLTLAGVELGRSLSLQVSNLAPNRFFILSRILSGTAYNGLEPVERLRSGTNGVLTSLEPANGERLPGLRGAGQYLLVQVSGPHALIGGITRNPQDQPVPQVPVRVTGQPWLTFSTSEGIYLLVAPTGAVQVAAIDLASGDTDFVDEMVADPDLPVAIDLGIRARGPRVTSLSPAPGSRNVNRVTPIVVTFSQPLNPGTVVGAGLRLFGTNGLAVTASLTLNQRGTIATLLPANPLGPGQTHTLVLSTNITDLTGRPLEGPTQFSFTTVSDAARGDVAKLTIFQPGATNLAIGSLDVRPLLVGFDDVPEKRNTVVAYGSPGTAETEVPVILVNESSGETATVLSKVDGSFAGFVRATEEDFVSAVFVNANGTRTTVPASLQRYDDGRLGLYRAGGILEAESDGGPVQVQIEPGVVETRSTFKLEPLTLVQLLNALRGTLPQNASLLGGFNFKMEGEMGEGASHVEMPVDVSRIPLGPGETPENGAYVLAIAREVNGTMTFQVVDKMKYVEGRLMTASPPFEGMVEAALRSTPSGALAGVVLGATVMSMYLGQGGVTLTGRAIDVPQADLQTSDGNLASDIALFIANENLNALLLATQARPLSGVFVTLRQPGAPQAFRAGNIADGVVYSTTDRNGRYAMISPLGLRSGIVSGFHPRYGYPISEPLIPFFDFQITGGVFEKNLIFTRALATSSDTPPRLSAGHTPYYPMPSNTTVLEITTSHASGPPSLIQVVDSVYALVPNVTVDPQNDVRLENIEDTVQGNRLRRRITVRSDKPVGASLRLTASVDAIGGPAAQTITHVIEFLGEPRVGTNPIVAVDPSDTAGPAVAQSDPPPGGQLTLGEPITVRFNEPIDKTILQNPQYISVNAPAAGVPSLRLSPDQQTLAISFGRLEPDTDYTLTIQQAVTDLRDNQLDQRPREEGNQEYTLNFHTSKLATRNLPGVEFGGGVVMSRHFVFALDRGQNGSLRVFNAIDPANPLQIAQVTLPGPPRDLVFIPQYSFRTALAPNSPIQTRDLLAIVGGELGSATVDRLGDVTFEGQFLRVFDVSNPANPVPVVRTIITRRPDAVTKIRWQPPYLAYLESGQLYEVGFVDLQEMILGFNLSLAERAELPLDGMPGRDKNFDGDYVDDEESLPVPPREPFQFFGKKFGFTPTDGTTQKVLDFDFSVLLGELDWLGVTLSAGNKLIPTGLLDPIVGPAILPGYRTLLFQGVDMDPETATLNFGANAHPKRVVGRLNARLNINGTEEARAVVLVSLSPDTDGVNKLAVIDISLPDSPRMLRLIPFPASLGLGPLQSVTVRPDGLLALATTTDTVLLEERRLAESNPPNNGLHPSIVGVLPGTGSGNISLGATEAGLFSVNLGGRSQLLQAAPRLEFVTFTAEDELVDPSLLAGDVEMRRRVLSSTNLAFRSRLFPGRFRATGGAAATLSPAAPEFHYHVLVYAPGGAEGHTHILLGLQSLNRAGDSYRNKGFAFPPVQAMSSTGLDGIGQALRPDCDAPTMPVKAYRVSNDPTNDLYNLYLSEPFALTYERMSTDEVEELQEVDGRPRHVLWSGFGLRAFIDPSAASDGAVGAFAAVPDAPNLRLNCPASGQVECYPGAYIVGPNPPPVGGDLAVPGSFGTVNAANGEFRHSTTDVELPSRLMNIRFTRTAVNQDLIEGPFGPGWDFNYNQNLIELRQEVFPQGSVDPLVTRDDLARSKRARPGDVKFVNGAGKVILFRNLGSNAPPEIASDPLVQDSRLGWLSRGGTFYKPDENEKGVFDLLYRFPEGQFVRLTPGGIQCFYDKLGRLEKIYHRYEKNYHVLHHNERGELIRIEDKSVDSPRHIDIGYYRKAGDRMFDSDFDLESDVATHNGRIARIVDYAGREVKFEYTPEGVLERRLGPLLAVVNNGFGGRPTTTYVGADCGQIVGVTAGNGANGGGNNASTPLFAANAPPNDNGVPVAAGGNSAGGTVSINVPVNNTAATVGGSSTTSSGPDQENNAATEIRFDDSGYPSNIKMTGAGAGNGTVNYGTTFNGFGLLEIVTYPEGNSIHYIYATDEAVFRSRGNLKRMEIHPGPRPPTTDTPNPLVATFGYDKKYNQPLGEHQDFNGFTMNYDLTDDLRSIASVTYSTGEEHKFEQYNQHGQLEREVTVEGIVNQFGYDDSRGFTISKTVGGLPTSYGYDDNQIGGKLGMPTSKTPPQNTAIQMEYDARLQMTLWKRGDYEEKRGYDENGNVKYMSRTLDTGELYEEENTYTQINFLEQRTIKDVEVGDTATPITITYTPDDAKRIRQIQVAPEGVTRTFHYDHLGNLIREATGEYFIEYAYDKNNNLIGIKPKGALTREIRYDGYDRARQIINKAGSVDETTTFSYFGAGQLRTRTATSPAGGDVEDYETTGIDALGRPTGMIRRGNQANSETSDITYSAGNGLTTVVTGPRDTTTLVEDSAGRLRRMTDSLSDVVFHPNANRQIERIESIEDGGATYNTFYEYNALDQLTRIRDDVAELFDLGTPRLDGQPRTIKDARGKTSTLNYTRLGELKSLLRPLGVLFKNQYDVHRMPKATLDAEDKGNRYAYDATLRLEKWTLRSGEDTSYDTPDLNNLPKAISFPGGGNAMVQYDNLGRVTEQSSSHDGQDYEESGVVYDAFDRIRSIEYQQGSGAANSATFGYDLMGPLTSAEYDELNEQYPVAYTIDTDGTYKSVTYPSGITVNEVRQPSGRLAQITDNQGPILTFVSFKGANLPLETRLGANIVERNEWDQRRRLLSRRYTLGSTNGAVLADLRYAYDEGFNPIARQFIHRHGRTDLFSFDDADRIDFFEHGARPVVSIAAPRPANGLQGGSGLAKGLYARDYVYGNSALDLLTAATLFNPDALARQGQNAISLLGPVLPAFAATLSGHDEGFKLARDVDGFNFAAPDGLGNAKESRLFVRPATPGAPDSLPVSAEFFHNARNDLVQVERSDGVNVEFHYQPGGLLHHRTVNQGLATLSSTHFVWDRARLIEEWDTTGANKQLRARYFYADSDAPVAADLPDGVGGLIRRYYLRDHAESVIAVANAQGQVIERVHYDAWGQPVIEKQDTTPPAVSTVRLNGNILVVAFTETVMPPLNVPAQGLATETADPSSRIAIASALGQANVTTVYQENELGFVFGSVLRLAVSPPLTGSNLLTIQAGAFVDEWGNPNPAIALPLNTAAPTAPILFPGPAQGGTSGGPVARSAIGTPFLFHGQYFDYDTGLIYLRARWYDPFTGHFLERDPMQYEDSPNLYAGFANNPVTFRDPTGMATRRRPGGGGGGGDGPNINGPGGVNRPRHPGRTEPEPSQGSGVMHGEIKKRPEPEATPEESIIVDWDAPEPTIPNLRRPGTHSGSGDSADEVTSPGRPRALANGEPDTVPEGSIPSGKPVSSVEKPAVPDDPFAPTQGGVFQRPASIRPEPEASAPPRTPAAPLPDANNAIPAPGPTIRPPMKPAPKPDSNPAPKQPGPSETPKNTSPSQPDPGEARRQAQIERAKKLDEKNLARHAEREKARNTQTVKDRMEEAHQEVKQGEAEARKEGRFEKAIKTFRIKF